MLRPSGDTEELIDLIEDVSREMGDVKLIILDTLSRALSGGNENSPDDMGNLVKHMDKVRHTLKAHLCVIHHSGKDRAKGARGHSLLRAATDTELEVAGHATESGANGGAKRDHLGGEKGTTPGEHQSLFSVSRACRR